MRPAKRLEGLSAYPVICPLGDTPQKWIKTATSIADHSIFQADEEYLGAGGTNYCSSYSFGWMHLFCKRTVFIKVKGWQ